MTQWLALQGSPGAIEVVPNLIGELRHRRDLLLAPRARAARENVVLLMAGYGGDDAPQSPLQRTNMDLQKKHLVLLRKKLFKKTGLYELLDVYTGFLLKGHLDLYMLCYNMCLLNKMVARTYAELTLLPAMTHQNVVSKRNGNL